MSAKQDDFYLSIISFLKKTGMRPTPFGINAAKERGFVKRMRDGRSCSLKKADSVRRFMANYLKNMPT